MGELCLYCTCPLAASCAAASLQSGCHISDPEEIKVINKKLGPQNYWVTDKKYCPPRNYIQVLHECITFHRKGVGIEGVSIFP